MKWSNLIKISWIISCFVALAWWYYSFGLSADLSEILKNESEVYLILLMFILTFPAGLIWAYLMALVSFIAEYFGANQGTELLNNAFITWLGFVFFGYFQWFKIIPFIIKKYHSTPKGSGQTKGK